MGWMDGQIDTYLTYCAHCFRCSGPALSFSPSPRLVPADSLASQEPSELAVFEKPMRC